MHKTKRIYLTSLGSGGKEKVLYPILYPLMTNSLKSGFLQVIIGKLYHLYSITTNIGRSLLSAVASTKISKTHDWPH